MITLASNSNMVDRGTADGSRGGGVWANDEMDAGTHRTISANTITAATLDKHTPE